MTQEDLNEVMGKSLANHQLRALAEDGGNLESALTLIDRLESELLNAQEHAQNLEFLLKQKNDMISQLEAEAYDRLMSGKAAMTLKEIANFKGRPITVDADGAINAHGAEPHLARGGFAGYSDCWVNDADDYEEIPESLVEIPDGFDWEYSLTLPDGWEVE